MGIVVCFCLEDCDFVAILLGRASQHQYERGYAALFLRGHPSESKLSPHGRIKRAGLSSCSYCCCSGGRIRTSDLRVMSPTSCLCSTPHRAKISVNENFSLAKSAAKIIILFLCKVKNREKFSLWHIKQVMSTL